MSATQELSFFTGGGVIGNDEKPASEIAIQADGKFIVAGSSLLGKISVTRYFPDGRIDRSFGNNGTSFIQMAVNSHLYDLKVDASGRILIGGSDYSTTRGSGFVLVRLKGDGTLDTSFGDGGKVQTNFETATAIYGRALAVQSDGKILSAGVHWFSRDTRSLDQDIALVRYNENGSLDRSFDWDGKVFEEIGLAPFAGGFEINELVILPSANLVVLGVSAGQAVLYSFFPNGARDQSLVSKGTQNLYGGSVAARQEDGKYIWAWMLGQEIYLYRLNEDGSVDKNFGNGGLVSIEWARQAKFEIWFSDILIQPDGKIVLTGTDGRDIMLVRISGDGFLDSKFGNNGFVTTDVSQGASAAAIQDDGIILVTATGGKVVRYATNGALDAGSAPLSSLGSALDDVLVGGSGDDILKGLAGNDTLIGNGGDDILEGGTGIDTAIYNNSRAQAVITKASNGFTVVSAQDGTDTLTDIERLKFSDVSVALDLTGNAGTTAKVLGIVFGAAAVKNKVFVGIGVDLLDKGMTYESLMQGAIEVALGAGASNAAVINLLYTNAAGAPPSAQELTEFVSLLDNGTYTQVSLGIYAAEHPINLTSIGLVGLATTGLEYLAHLGS
jgi:uncharacterized delta-60 repeat protein